MSRPEDLPAAVAAGVLTAHERGGELLRSIVDVARAAFGAKACSIMLHDAEAAELVFTAVSGEGAGTLEGRRLPASSGLAGWVLASAEPILIEDVTRDPRFDRAAAESTGYVPAGIMVAPLLRDDEQAAGVLSVLDRTRREGMSLSELDLLGRFAGQAAAALEVSESARHAREVLEGAGGDLGSLARLAGALDAREGPRREAAGALVSALETLLGPAPR